MTPTILLVSTSRWLAPARLAAAFTEVGCHVQAVCPRDHALETTAVASRVYRYRTLDPVGSLRAAIDTSEADLVIPCDDLATHALHALYEQARVQGASGAAICAALERSLGEPSNFAIVDARARLTAFAAHHGVRVPPTMALRNAGELTEWLRRHAFPAFLKADGTCGGRGVRVIHSESEGKDALAVMSRPPGIGRVAKRAIINRDLNYILPFALRTEAVVNVQQLVIGSDANSTVACWQGRVLGCIHVAVLHTLGEYGPASVVRLIENQEMSRAVETMVAALRLSGLVGFDFVIEARTGDAYLIEVNPRATQLGHLPLGPSRDLPTALRAAMSGDRLHERPRVPADDVIAFFPQEWLRDPNSPYLRTAYHDVPWDQPALIRSCLKVRTTEKLWTALSARAHGYRVSIRREESLLRSHAGTTGQHG